MQDPDRYTHNKFFIIGILTGILITLFLIPLTDSNDSEISWQAGGTLLFLVIPLVVGLVFWWPIDYLIYKRTIKQMKGKPRTIDPNFKLKRNILIACIALATITICLINTYNSIKYPNN